MFRLLLAPAAQSQAVRLLRGDSCQVITVVGEKIFTLALLAVGKEQASSVSKEKCLATYLKSAALMKAFLREQGIPVECADSKIASLLLNCASADPDFESYRNDFEQLDQFGIETLYPGRWASQQDALDASAILERVRSFIRSKLGLE